MALIFVALVGSWTGALVEGYDAASRSVTLPGGGEIKLGGKRRADADRHLPLPVRGHAG